MTSEVEDAPTRERASFALFRSRVIVTLSFAILDILPAEGITELTKFVTGGSNTSRRGYSAAAPWASTVQRLGIRTRFNASFLHNRLHLPACRSDLGAIASTNTKLGALNALDH